MDGRDRTRTETVAAHALAASCARAHESRSQNIVRGAFTGFEPGGERSPSNMCVRFPEAAGRIGTGRVKCSTPRALPRNALGR